MTPLAEKHLWAGMDQGLLAIYNGSDQLLVRYKYAGGRLPVSFSYSSAIYYPVYDQVGSLRAIYNTSGTKVHEITYDSFGNILTESGTYTGPLPHGYAGGLHDRDTGLVRFGYRDYDPKVGRWTAKDPIGFAGGDVSLYSYVFGDPISLADPEGMGWYETTLYHSGNFFSGMGDVLSFGATDWIREGMGTNSVVNKCSWIYTGGQAGGVAVSAALGGGIAARAGARFGPQVGMNRPHLAFPRGIERVERSHWISKLKGTRLDGSWNIKLLWGRQHALSDPQRYRFMRKWWKTENPRYGTLRSQWTRMPYWAQGGMAGAAAGGASAAGCGCED